MLTLDDVRFAYPNPGPSYRFSMLAEAGAITAIRGASGAGKSTLLDLIAGFLRPDAGLVRIDDIDVTAQPPEQRPVSIQFQSEILFEHLSAARNVSLGLPDADPARVASALAEVGLPGIGPQRAATLSGGQKQRVALARTLLRDSPGAVARRAILRPRRRDPRLGAHAGARPDPQTKMGHRAGDPSCRRHLGHRRSRLSVGERRLSRLELLPQAANTSLNSFCALSSFSSVMIARLPVA